MSNSPFQNWLLTQEYNGSRVIFLVEWLALFAMAWAFWSVLFLLAPGSSMGPGLAATLVAGLYATSLIYGRLLRVTGCKKCASPMPFLRREVARWHAGQREECVEMEYGGEEYERHYVRIYAKVVRTDVVVYRCRQCRQAWEEKVELPSGGYKEIGRRDL